MKKVAFPKSRVLARSNNSSNTNGGVAYTNANNDASNANTNIGSRLKFRKNNVGYGTVDASISLPGRETSLASWQKIKLMKLFGRFILEEQSYLKANIIW